MSMINMAGSVVSKRQAGVTMIEVLVALLIIVLGLLGLAGMQVRMHQAEFESYHQRVFFIFPPELGMVLAAKRKAEELGFPTHILFNNYTMKVEASQLGRIVANLALHTELDGEPFRPPCALISTGEMLVTVGKETGMGGRNQESRPIGPPRATVNSPMPVSARPRASRTAGTMPRAVGSAVKVESISRRNTGSIRTITTTATTIAETGRRDW